MQITEQQIQERAQQIGNRPYHPVPDDASSMYRTERSNGITIRQELMRTAMGGLTSNDQWTIEFKVDNDWSDYIKRVSGGASELTNALLLEMARHELGVGDD